jgi:hypothetical protein
VLRHVQRDFGYVEATFLRILCEVPVLSPRPILPAASSFPPAGRLDLPDDNITVVVSHPSARFVPRSLQAVVDGDERRALPAPPIQVVLHQPYSRVVVPRVFRLSEGDDAGSFDPSRA